MAEYIKREAVEEMLENAQMVSDGEYSGYCTEDVCIGTIHAADVAPKSEVAREIFEEIEGFIEKNIKEITKAYKGGRANGKTVLCAKYSAFIDAKKYFAELKKKYTEVETDERSN